MSNKKNDDSEKITNEKLTPFNLLREALDALLKVKPKPKEKKKRTRKQTKSPAIRLDFLL